MEQKKLMAVLVLGQQCTLGNYKHKRGEKKSWTPLYTIVTNKRTSALKQKGAIERGEMKQGKKMEGREKGEEFKRRQSEK